jgi:hypothetical protein
LSPKINSIACAISISYWNRQPCQQTAQDCTYLVEQRVEIHGGEVRTFTVETIRRIMARLSHPSIVHKVLVELWLRDGLVVVTVDILVDRDSEILGVRLENVGEVRRLGLWRDTLTGWSVSREASNGVERRLRHPIRVVLLDRSLDGTLEPFDVLVRLGPVELIEDLKRKVGEERGLRTGQVLLCQGMVI